MALPILNSSRYEATIPSTGQTIEFRPFLVKEEKILMVAMESKDNKMMMKALKDILNACIFDEVNVSKLTSFDLEELFLRLRAKSVGEKAEVNLKCGACTAKTPVEVNLDEIKMSDMPEQTHIMLTDTVGVSFKYPSVDLVASLDFDPDKTKPEKQMDMTYKMIISCIENIFDNDTVWDSESQTEKEMRDFIDGLNSQQFGKITEFFGSLPTLEHTIEFNCISCGSEQSLELRGLSSFFT
jgi:hypothetical protein|tara:strand:+ start:26526 stop:27245 length:720 start_codon:yes stop_codon:yes gene_type:complete